MITAPILNVLCTSLLLSSEPRPYPLMVGDPAPKLAVSRWVQGKPVPAFEKGKIYVIDFWATWCGPCIQSMPKLSGMQREFGDKVAFIAVDVWDYQERVEPFVKEMGEKLSYRVALDTLPPVPTGEDNVPMWAKDNGTCSKTWLKASGDDGIPKVFVVDGAGKIAWMGSDPDELKRVTAEVVSGRWDLQKATKAHADKMARQQEIASARTQMFAAMGRKHWEEALKQGRLLRSFEPEAQPGAFFEILVYMGQRPEAYRLADEMIKGDDANALHQMAQLLVFTLEMRGTEDLDMAHKLAARSNELSQGARGATLEVLARIAWFRGDKEKAISLQRTAVEKTAAAFAKDRASRRLRDYGG